jgi:hypothetical protein
MRRHPKISDPIANQAILFWSRNMGSLAGQRIKTSAIGFIVCLSALLLLSTPSVFSASKAQNEGRSDPRLLSVFPLAGRPGSTVEIEIRGDSLEGASSVWCDIPAITGKLVTVEAAHDDYKPKVDLLAKRKKAENPYRAVVELQIGPAAGLGVHSLRLLSPRGLSNSVPFRVTKENVITEDASPHATVQEAQKTSVPAILNGKMAKPGELDYYSFHAQKGEELHFEVLLAENFDPRLALYRAGGSWFDAKEPTRLLFKEERSSDVIPVEVGGTYRFDESGEYFLEVGGLYGEGCPTCSYQVKVSPREISTDSTLYRPYIVFDQAGNKRSIDMMRSDWSERSWDRKIEGGWMGTLEARAVTANSEATLVASAEQSAQHSGGTAEIASKSSSAPLALARPTLVTEHEPDDQAAQAQPISIPAVVDGAIGHPGDIDSFKFSVKAGEKLAFEIETPDAQPPQFNPRIGVVDSQDKELFSNVYRRMSLFNNNAERTPFLQAVQPKATYTFEHAGEYLVQIRDITTRYGGPDYRYRLMIRPQIPHVGEITIADGDHVNLVRGQAKALTLTTSFEEGFNGSVSFAVEGLPQGVEALPGSQMKAERGANDADLNPEIVLPKNEKTTIILLAQANSPVTSRVALAQLRCHPIIDGKPGESFVAASIPVVVIDPPKPEPSEPSGKEPAKQ